jgi:hypothetical protein
MKHINLKKKKGEVDKTPSLEEPFPAVTWEHNNPSSGVEEQQHGHPSGFTPPRAQSHPTRFIITLLA